MKLSILVPAYNESRTVEEILRRLGALPIEKEIVFVDDGSSDDTYAIAKGLEEEIEGLRAFRQDRNRGKGSAIRRALEEATGEVSVVQDADLEYEPNDLVRMLALYERRKLDALYGSRRLGGRSDATHARYYWGGVLLSFLTNRLYGSKLTDEPTCYKMVRTELLRELDLECEGFEFCPEVTAKLLRRGVEIPELQIAYHPRTVEEGKKIKLKDAWEAIAVLLKWRYKRLPGPHGVKTTRADSVGGVLLVLAMLLVGFGNVWFGGETLMCSAGMPGAVHSRAGLDGPPLRPQPTMDQVSAFIDEPLAVAMAKQLRDGSPPLWNPDNGGGAPLLGNMQAAPLSPFRWPALAVPESPRIYDLGLLLRFFVGGLCAFLFFRGRAASVAGAAAGACAFMLCGYFVLHASMHHLSVEVLLPALLLCADRIGRDGRASATTMAAWIAACWASMVGGNPEATLAIHLFAAVFIAAHVHRWGAGVLKPLAVGYFVALLGALPYFLPAIEYLQHSAHHHAESTGLDHLRPWMALSWFSTDALRTAGGGIDAMAPPWIGTSVLALASLGAIAAWRRPSATSGLPGKLFAVTALFCALKFVGFPVLNEVGRLPMLDLLIFYKYGNPVFVIALAGLVALGVDALRAKRAAGAWAVAGPVAVLGIGFVLLSWTRGKLETNGLSAEFEPRLGTAFVLVVLAVGALALLASMRSSFLGRWLPWLACALVVVELGAAAAKERPDRRDPWVAPPYVEYLEVELKRALVNEGDRPRSFGIGSALPPNTNAAFGVPDIRLHDGLYVARYERYIREFLDPNSFGPQFDGGRMRRFSEAEVERFRGLSAFHLDRGIDRLAEEQWRVARDVDLGEDGDAFGYALAGVRWHLLYGRAEDIPLLLRLLQHPEGRWRLAFPEELALPPAESLRVLGDPAMQTRLYEHLARGDQLVLEDRRALPRVWLSDDVLPSASPEESVAQMRSKEFELGRSVVVEGAAARRAIADSPPPGTAKLMVHTPGEVRVRVQARRPSILVLSDTFYPGWQARLDGEPVEILPANLMFRGVEVPAGRHEVVFVYAPSSWKIGVWAALIALVLGAATLLYLSRRSGRQLGESPR